MPTIYVPGGDLTLQPHISIEGTFDSEGKLIPLEALAKTYGYDGSNNLTSITATDGVNTWVQTLTYSSGRLATISQWVRQ